MPSLYRYPPQQVSWTARDVIYFALSIGCTADDMHYVYEEHPEFAAFPTYPILLSFKHNHTSTIPWMNHFTRHSLPPAGKVDGYPSFPALDPIRVVDGERTLEVVRPLPTSSQGKQIEIRSEVVAIWDKGKGRSTIVKTEHLIVQKLDGGENVVFAKMSNTDVFMGQGGWGGPNDTASEPKRPPELTPSSSIKRTHHIPATAHLLYRLNGDYNPLHAVRVDNAIVQPTPILHGLYSWNAVCRDVLNALAHGDPTALLSFSAKFASPVWPGDALDTEMCVVSRHEESDASIHEVQFVTRVKGKVVLRDGRARLRVRQQKSTSRL